MEKYFIYTLTFEGKVFYIGKTKNLKNRLKEHKKSSRLKRTYKERFISQILSENKDFEIIVIDEVDIGTENYWEIYWISEYKKLGHNLYNTSIGGDGGDTWSGRKHSDETKNKLRKIRYQQIENGMIFKVKGENNGRSKLTAEQVIEMRKLREDGFSYGKLSIKFGVAKSTVIDIIKKRKWIDI
jgi:hypothetical protein